MGKRCALLARLEQTCQSLPICCAWPTCSTSLQCCMLLRGLVSALRMEQVCAKRIACLVDLYSISGPDGLQLKHKVTGVAPAFQLFPMVLLTLGALKYAVTEGNTALLEGDPRGHIFCSFFSSCSTHLSTAQRKWRQSVDCRAYGPLLYTMTTGRSTSAH